MGVGGNLSSLGGTYDYLDAPTPTSSQWCWSLTDSVQSSVWRVLSVLFWVFSSGRRNTACRSDKCQSRAVLLGCVGVGRVLTWEQNPFVGSPRALAKPLRLYSNLSWNPDSSIHGYPRPPRHALSATWKYLQIGTGGQQGPACFRVQADGVWCHR